MAANEPVEIETVVANTLAEAYSRGLIQKQVILTLTKREKISLIAICKSTNANNSFEKEDLKDLLSITRFSPLHNTLESLWLPENLGLAISKPTTSNVVALRITLTNPKFRPWLIAGFDLLIVNRKSGLSLMIGERKGENDGLHLRSLRLSRRSFMSQSKSDVSISQNPDLELCLLAMLAVGCSNGLGGGSEEPTERIAFDRASWLGHPKPTNLNSVRFAMQDSALHELKFRMTPTEVENALGPPSETYSGAETMPVSPHKGYAVGVDDHYSYQCKDFYYLIGKDSNSSKWSYYLVVRFHDNQLYYAYLGLN